MYDDIAHNRRNPTPGIIVNKPDGPDVYQGVPKDYTGKDVTPENFLKILQGEDMTGIGSGKTIASGADDFVFVYFADHGAPNIIAFPRGELHAQDLNEAIQNMAKETKYKEMVFYVEACESGSMFNRHKLPSNINVYATTAANGEESSYACYWSDKRDTYLGDVYSIKWLEDSDIANMKTETLYNQFLKVKEETNTSHVQQFGDLTMGQVDLIGEFQSTLDNHNETKKINSKVITRPGSSCGSDAVPSPEVPLMILYNKLQAANSADEHASIMYMMQVEQDKRLEIKETMRKIVEKIFEDEEKKQGILTKTATPTHEDCYKQAATMFRTKCFDFNKYEYALRQVFVLANLCDEGLSSNMILRSIESACQ